MDPLCVGHGLVSEENPVSALELGSRICQRFTHDFQRCQESMSPRGPVGAFVQLLAAPGGQQESRLVSSSDTRMAGKVKRDLLKLRWFFFFFLIVKMDLSQAAFHPAGRSSKLLYKMKDL